ncbi:MAG: NfeD family protein [Pseudomonadota bacterium]
MEWLDSIQYWHWWLLGVVLLILEIFSPGAFFLWLALAAGIMGTLLLIAPEMSWEVQLLVYAVLGVASLVAGRMWLRRHPIKTDEPTLNRRAEQYVGRVFNLGEPIVNGHGKIHVDDTTWKISGPDCDAGTRVTVTGVDGTILRVECED